MAKTFDPACYDLADTFISDHPDLRGDPEQLRNALACDIQQVIEDFLWAREEDQKQEDSRAERFPQPHRPTSA